MISGEEVVLKVKIFDNRINLRDFHVNDNVLVDGVVLKEAGVLIFGAVFVYQFSKFFQFLVPFLNLLDQFFSSHLLCKQILIQSLK